MFTVIPGGQQSLTVIGYFQGSRGPADPPRQELCPQLRNRNWFEHMLHIYAATQGLGLGPADCRDDAGLGSVGEYYVSSSVNLKTLQLLYTIVRGLSAWSRDWLKAGGPFLAASPPCAAPVPGQEANSSCLLIV